MTVSRSDVLRQILAKALTGSTRRGVAMTSFWRSLRSNCSVRSTNIGRIAILIRGRGCLCGTRPLEFGLGFHHHYHTDQPDGVQILTPVGSLALHKRYYFNAAGAEVTRDGTVLP